jgi:hypothetical protein
VEQIAAIDFFMLVVDLGVATRVPFGSHICNVMSK